MIDRLIDRWPSFIGWWLLVAAGIYVVASAR